MAKEVEKKAPTKSGTVVRPCNCKSAYQDGKYGPGQRVWNYGPKRRTCTVCGTKG